MRRQVFKKQSSGHPVSVPLSMPSQSPFQTSALLSHPRGGFRIPVSGLLNSVSNRAAQGQDVGSPPLPQSCRAELSGWSRAWGQGWTPASPPWRSPDPVLRGQRSPPEPQHWDALRGRQCMAVRSWRRRGASPDSGLHAHERRGQETNVTHLR